MFTVSALLLTAVQSQCLLFHCGCDRITELSIHIAQPLASSASCCVPADWCTALTDWPARMKRHSLCCWWRSRSTRPLREFGREQKRDGCNAGPLFAVVMAKAVLSTRRWQTVGSKQNCPEQGSGTDVWRDVRRFFIKKNVGYVENML